MQTLSMHLALYCHSSLLKPYGYVWFPENVREKIRRKNGKKEKAKEYKNFHLFGYPWKIQGGKKKEFIFFCLVNHKKKLRKNGRKTKSTICLRWLSI